MHAPFIASVIALVTAIVAQAAPARDFAAAPGWAFACSVTPVARDGHFPDRTGVEFTLIWSREMGFARFTGTSGAGYGLAEIPGYAMAAGQGVAHFHASPATGAFGEDGRARAAWPTDLFHARLVSVRSDGHVALTAHVIEYGDMRAISNEGTCTVTELKAEDL